MSFEVLDELNDFIDTFDDKIYPFKNDNINFTASTTNYRKKYELIQKYIHECEHEKAVAIFLKLLKSDACQMLLSGMLLSLFHIVWDLEWYQEAFSLLSLSREMNEKYTPFLLFDYDDLYERLISKF